jgi:SAM-dependent methyltransferase
MDQQVFLHTYRGRQSALHHASYLRMSKVLLSLRAVGAVGIELRGARVFDFGFGTGTFLRYCPKSAQLFGLEQDERTVDEVIAMLRERGFARVELEAVEADRWEAHRLLSRQYDLVHLSHVLEHISDPARLLARVGDCLAERGCVLALVPIHERAPNPHHLHRVDRRLVEAWSEQAGLHLSYYEEADPLLYWVQPLYTANHGWRHHTAQALSVALGVPATLLGPERWHAVGRALARPTRSLPTQAVFVLERRRVL